MLWAILLCQCLLVAAGPGRRRSLTMQSRAVDTRVQLEVAEGLPRGTLVGAIPTRSGFTYRFNEPPVEFALDAATGTIRTTMELDREFFKSDRFDLVVLSSQPTYPIEVRIVITDVNDNAPEFPEPSIAVTFSESAAAGTRLLLDSAFDRDLGTNGVSDDYRIVAGNKEDKFRLVVTTNPSGDTSYLHLETTGKLDREVRASYTLNVSARDGGKPPLFGYLQVNVTVLDVNDNPPMFDHSDYNVSLNESVVPGTQVLQVMATDNDVGDNAKITYYLEDLERQFIIDPETGIISTSERLSCVQQQNCSDNSGRGGCPRSCVISVTAWDHGIPRQVGRAYVTVNLIQVNANNHDPIINFTYFLRPAKFATVDENAVNGSVVAAVTIVDLDEGLNGDTVVVIKAGNELNHFRLDSTPAVRVNGVLDREEISKYNLTIVATDRGSPPRSSSASLIIYVNDVNDHEPVFEKSEYSGVLSELSPPGTYVAGTTATDADTGVNAHVYYAFVSGNERNWFEMNTDSGLITTRTTIDREIQDTVELNISARDGGPNPKWAYTRLKITILDENDEAPKFSADSINVTLSENTPINSLVAMLTAADHDQGTNGSVAYYLVPDSEHKQETFSLDSLTGQLTTKMRLDREEVDHYEVKVVARDQGVPPQSSTAVVHVRVQDINDNSPVFYPLKYFSTIREDLNKASFVLQVFAHDLDDGENAELRYSITSGGDDLFDIDERTGVISLKYSLSSSSKALYRLKIGVKDLGGRSSDQEAIVELIKDNVVQDVEFDSYNGYEFKVMEDHADKEAGIGTEVGTIQVRAGEYRGSKDDLQYHIVYGDATNRFKINQHTGVITRAARLDRELEPSYSLTCVVRDNLSFGKTTVNITVLDLNDNRPVFDLERTFINVPENWPVGHEVYHAMAKDMDAGTNSRVQYNLTVNADNLFRINGATGVVYLSKPMHKESGSVVSIQIMATDFGDPQLSSKQTVLITVEDVNDHTPVFDHTSYETSLLESTAVNNRFFRLAASDADLGPNGLISYSIVEGNIEGKFGVFPDGFLYVKSKLDRETKDYYSLVVMAKDGGEPSRSSTVPLVVHVIDENDNSPQFTNSTFTFHIVENEPPDSFVGKLAAFDDDIGRNAELTFSFPNTQNDFVVDPKNGFIRTLSTFDRESLVEKTGKSFVSLEAIVNDNGQIRLKDKATIVVFIDDVNDNSPSFLKTPYKVQVPEAATVGSQILKIATFDADEGVNGDVFYTISSGNDGKKFDVDPATGQVVISKALDREEKSRYVLTVTASDGAVVNSLSATTTITIDVLDENDNAPVFSQSESKVTALETTPVGTKLTQFQATDSDVGINSDVSFSIESGNRRDTFQIDSASGVVTLHKPLDYEELTSYTLTIVASDGGNPKLSSTTVLTVSVLDSNDNPPAFPNTAIVRQIREGISINTPIVTVTAEDPDSGVNGQVRYAISNQQPQNARNEKHFGINPLTGVIHTLLPIDREAVDTFRLTVVATDQAQDPTLRLSAEKLVTVIVEDINDNAPLFVSMNAAILPSFFRDGPVIMRTHARDLDSNTNGLVTYDLVGGNTDIFKLNRNTGALSVKKGLSSVSPIYRLTVKATDEAVQSERKSTETYITVVSRGDAQPPVFASGNMFGTVVENEPPGTSVLTVSASLPGSMLEYLVTNVTGDGRQVDRLFDIDSLGVLSTAAVLDREAGSIEYEVEICAVSVNTTTPHVATTKVSFFLFWFCTKVCLSGIRRAFHPD